MNDNTNIMEIALPSNAWMVLYYPMGCIAHSCAIYWCYVHTRGGDGYTDEKGNYLFSLRPYARGRWDGKNTSRRTPHVTSIRAGLMEI